MTIQNDASGVITVVKEKKINIIQMFTEKIEKYEPPQGHHNLLELLRILLDQLMNDHRKPNKSSRYKKKHHQKGEHHFKKKHHHKRGHHEIKVHHHHKMHHQLKNYGEFPEQFFIESRDDSKAIGYDLPERTTDLDTHRKKCINPDSTSCKDCGMCRQL